MHSVFFSTNICKYWHQLWNIYILSSTLGWSPLWTSTHVVSNNITMLRRCQRSLFIQNGSEGCLLLKNVTLNLPRRPGSSSGLSSKPLQRPIGKRDTLLMKISLVTFIYYLALSEWGFFLFWWCFLVVFLLSGMVIAFFFFTKKKLFVITDFKRI